MAGLVFPIRWLLDRPRDQLGKGGGEKTTSPLSPEIKKNTKVETLYPEIFPSNWKKREIKEKSSDANLVFGSVTPQVPGLVYRLFFPAARSRQVFEKVLIVLVFVVFKEDKLTGLYRYFWS